jgi:hypothetical protein
VLLVLLALPGILSLRQVPGSENMNVLRAASWVRQHVRDDVVVCDREKLVGFYAKHPYAEWKGSAADPRWEDLNRICGRPDGSSGGGVAVILALKYAQGVLPAESIGPYLRVAAFESGSGRAGVLVLYASAADGVVRQARADYFEDSPGRILSTWHDGSMVGPSR